MDWNNNGKHDLFDDFMDYRMCQNSTKHSGASHSSGNMSTFGAILCVFGGLVLTGLLFSGTDIDDVPAILLLIVWMVLSVVIGAIIGALKK